MKKQMIHKEVFVGHIVILLTITFVIVAIFYGIFLSAFSQSFASLYAKNISLASGKCSMEIDTWNSGIHFYGYKYIVEDKTLQITVYTETIFSRPGKNWPVKISIIDTALTEVERICFKDGHAVRQIYPE